MELGRFVALMILPKPQKFSTAIKLHVVFFFVRSLFLLFQISEFWSSEHFRRGASSQVLMKRDNR